MPESPSSPRASDFRLTFDAQGVGQTQGYIFGVDDVLFRIVAPGDTDGNGEVDSDDLFAILEAGKYNHPEFGPATWLEGDFSGDDLVNSTDLFLILGTGKYNQGPYTTTTGPAALATVQHRPSRDRSCRARCRRTPPHIPEDRPDETDHSRRRGVGFAVSIRGYTP